MLIMNILEFIFRVLQTPYCKIFIYPTHAKGTSNIWEIYDILVEDCVVYLNNLLTIYASDKNILSTVETEITRCVLIIKISENMYIVQINISNMCYAECLLYIVTLS